MRLSEILIWMVEMTACPLVWNLKWVIWKVDLIQMVTKMVDLI